MKLVKSNPQKSRAQAMVEFAIALPLLLALLYGILEAGRLLFLYSTVVTASRQAVRYGSVTDIGNNNVPHYDDCTGIRASAQKFAYLGQFDTIDIQYDSGPSDNTPDGSCTGTTSNFKPNTDNTSRITVTVTEPFTPIVPKLVPFAQRNISATSSRTIIISVTIEVTQPATLTYTPSFTPSPTKTYTPSVTYTPSRTPTITNTPLFTYTPSRTPSPAPTGTNTLMPTMTFTPSPTPTRVPSCNSVTHDPTITKTGNNLQMTITNPYDFPLTFQDVTLTWNNDKGHQTGSDKTLILQSASLAGTNFWTGSVNNQATFTISAMPTIAPRTTVIISFTFHQTYDNFDGTESIYINLFTPGCESDPIHNP